MKNEQLQTAIFNLHRIASENSNTNQRKLIEASMKSLFNYPDFDLLNQDKEQTVVNVLPIKIKKR